MSTVESAATISEDGHLVTRCLHGEAGAVDILVQRFHSRLVSHLRHHVAIGRPDDAEDLAQESMAKALRALDTFDVSRPLWPWLRRIAENTAHDHYRLARHRREVIGGPDQVHRAMPVQADHAEQHAIRDEVGRVLAALPQVHRDVIVQVDLRDLPQREAAERLGISYVALRKRLGRAHEAFRTALESLGSVPLLQWISRLAGSKAATSSLVTAGLSAAIPALIVVGLGIAPGRLDAGVSTTIQSVAVSGLRDRVVPTPVPDAEEAAPSGPVGAAAPSGQSPSVEVPEAPRPDEAQGVASGVHTPEVHAPVGGVGISNSFEDGEGFTVYSFPVTDVDGSGPVEVSNDSEEASPIHAAACDSPAPADLVTCRG